MSSASRADRFLEFDDGYRVAPSPCSCSWFEGEAAKGAVKYTQNILSLKLVSRIPARRMAAWGWGGNVHATRFDPHTMFEVTNTAIGSDYGDEEEEEEDDDSDTTGKYAYVPCFYEWPVPPPHKKLWEAKNKTAPWARVWLPECIVDRASPPTGCRLSRIIDGGVYIQAVFYLQSTISLDAPEGGGKGKTKKAEDTVRMTWTIVDAMLDRMVTPDVSVLDVRELRVCSWNNAIKWIAVVAKRLAAMPPTTLPPTRIPVNCGETMLVINANPDLRALSNSLLLQIGDEAPDQMMLNRLIKDAVCAAGTHHFPFARNLAKLNKQLENIVTCMRKFMLNSNRTCTCGRCVFESFASYTIGGALVTAIHPPGALSEIPAKITYDKTTHVWSDRTFDDGHSAVRWSCLMGPELSHEDIRGLFDSSLEKVRKLGRLLDDPKHFGNGNVEKPMDFFCTLFRILVVCTRDTLATYARMYPRFLSVAVSDKSPASPGKTAAEKATTPSAKSPGSTGASSPHNGTAAGSKQAVIAEDTPAAIKDGTPVVSSALATPPSASASSPAAAAGGSVPMDALVRHLASTGSLGADTVFATSMPVVERNPSFEEITDPLRLQIMRRQLYFRLKMRCVTLQVADGMSKVSESSLKKAEAEMAAEHKCEEKAAAFEKALHEVSEFVELNEQRADELTLRIKGLGDKASELQTLKDELHETQTRLGVLTQERDKLKVEVDGQRSTLQGFKAGLTKYENTRKQLEAKFADLSRKLEAAKTAAGKTPAIDMEISAARQSCKAMQAKLTAAEAKLESVAAEERSLQAEITNCVVEDTRPLVAKVHAAEASLNALKAQESELQARLEDLRSGQARRQANSASHLSALQRERSDAHKRVIELGALHETQTAALVAIAKSRDGLLQRLVGMRAGAPTSDLAGVPQNSGSSLLELDALEKPSIDVTGGSIFSSLFPTTRQQSLILGNATGAPQHSETYPSAGMLLGSLGVEI